MTTVLSQISANMFSASIELVAKVTLILLLTWVTSMALRRASAAMRHLVATVSVCLVLLAPCLISLGLRWPVRVLPAPPSISGTISETQGGSLANASAAMIKTPNGSGSRSATQLSKRRTQSDSTSASQEVSRTETLSSPVTVPPQPAATGVRGDTDFGSLGRETAKKIDWRAWVMATWLVGSLLLISKLVLSHFRLQQVLRNAQRVNDPTGLDTARQIERGMGIARPVTLWSSYEVEVPITTGILYPKIVLPAESEEWSVERRRAVLLHEFAHIRRLDAVTQWLAEIAIAVYWFHPLVWWTARLMQSERERACDDLVLCAGAKASDYASDLLEFGSRARQRFAYGAALAMARRSQLEGRLLAILDEGINRRPASFGTIAAVALIACAIALPITAIHAIAAPVSDQTATPQEKPSPTQAAAEPQKPTTTTTQPAAATAPSSGIAEGVATAGPAEAPTGGVSQAAPTVPAAASPASNASTTSSASAANSYSYGYTTGGSENLQAFECRSDGHSVSDWIQSNNGRRTWKANWSGAGPGGERCQISLYAEGNVVFKTDLTGIQSISPGGFLELSESLGSHFRKLTAKPDNAGNVELSWTVDGQARTLGDQERAWLAAFLLALERQTAFSAETRVPALLQKGGPSAVLDEVNNMTGDYARARYLLFMIDDAKLNDSQLLRTIEFTGKSMTSDYEHARVLLAVAKQYSMDDEASRRAFLTSANGLKSDYEHARVLMELLKRPHLSVETRNTAIQSASNIHSDYERARVLIAATCDCNNVAAAPLPRVFFETVDGIKSDYEHARVLLTILDNRKQQLSSDDAKAILQSTTHIRSDYERRRVLTGLVERKLLSEALVPLFLQASESIQSGNDHSTVLIALINSGQLNTSHLEQLINSAASIHQDYELSRVLTTLASAYPLKANARATYIKVAQQIHSEYERNRALAAVNSSTML